MSLNIDKELAALNRLPIAELRARYAELSGDATQSRNRSWLIRRIIWRMQSIKQGGLSERAIQRARELAEGADLRVTAPRQPKPMPDAGQRTRTIARHFRPGSRVPLPGTKLTRTYKGQLIEVCVLRDGFEFEGERYPSLRAVARHVTGSHWNGFRFFQLDGRR